MSISIVQSQASDVTSNTTSIAATLASPTTAGSLIVASVVWHGTSAGSISAPAGWTQAWTSTSSGVQIHTQFYFLDTTGGHSSFTFTWSGTADGVCAALYELSATNGWAATPLNASASNFSSTATTTQTSGTTAATSAASAIAIASFSNGGNTTAGAWTSPTNGYTSDLFIAEAGATSQVDLHTSYKILTATSAGESTGFTVATATKYSAGIGVYAEGSGATTNTRNVPASAALLATNTRAVPTSAALQQPNIQRVISSSAALLSTLSRVISSSAALLATLSRDVPSSVALRATDVTRVTPASAALQQPDVTRVTSASAALLATLSRVVGASAALTATRTRGIVASAALSSVVGTVTGIVFLPNALVTLARGTYDASTKATSAPAVYLANVLARVEPTAARAYKPLPDAALASDYTVTVPSGADIAAGARITRVTTLDGATPWPDEGPTTNEYWEVVYADETSAFFIPQRLLYIKRVTGGGPTHY